uniref:Group II intron, maturase-specific domain n=1 Tax=Candidatus Kentrum sp. LPFa TaxID=2126335 RepID=A0A450WCM2_9GAMM|nr:MAG: Group II intron, maturase-specific domain [Candidatus Kentron sp. LPFa]VFK30498.1 MAG: Group II intron, maturase-specific domain [Candidatus Kentron sp. LPFa]
MVFEKVVKKHSEGDAFICRYADDFVCGFRHEEDAVRFYEALPRRLGKFGLIVAPKKTRILRFSRYPPSRDQRFNFLGFDLYWCKDRKGIPQVKRRTARKKLRGACQRVKEWIKENRHLPNREFINGLNSQLRGHYNYYGVREGTHCR